jgi:FKBP-type peptidyl-prolyl cis-trans isomerase
VSDPWRAAPVGIHKLLSSNLIKTPTQDYIRQKTDSDQAAFAACEIKEADLMLSSLPSVIVRREASQPDVKSMRALITIFAIALVLAMTMAISNISLAADEKTPVTKPKVTVTAHKALPLPKEVKKLMTHDLVVGKGEAVATGKKLKVQYTGWLYDPSTPEGRGAQFDTTAGGEAFEFKLGVDRVIKGWENGLLGMKVGGKRRLLIPADLGYGAKGAGDRIPPNSTLMFEVELASVQSN